jgi:hypothetical protein
MYDLTFRYIVTTADALVGETSSLDDAKQLIADEVFAYAKEDCLIWHNDYKGRFTVVGIQLGDGTYLDLAARGGNLDGVNRRLRRAIQQIKPLLDKTN